MIILYIPFEKPDAGDLTYNALFWQKNHMKNSMEELKIIYFNEDFDEETIEKNTTIFVLAHGFDSEPVLANSVHKEIIIPIETLVERFNRDFVVAAHQLGTIHLYCCGGKAKNAFLAKEFQQALMRPEYSNINYYTGVLYVPNDENKLMTRINNKDIPAVAESLHAIHEEIEPEYYRKTIKTGLLQFYKQRAKESHRINYFSLNREHRSELLLFKRGINRVVSEEKDLPNILQTITSIQ